MIKEAAKKPTVSRGNDSDSIRELDIYPAVFSPYFERFTIPLKFIANK